MPVVRATDGKIVDLFEVVSSASAALGQLPFEPGTPCAVANGGHFIFAKAGSGVLAPGHVCKMLGTFSTGSIAFGYLDPADAALNGAIVAVARSSMNSGDYGWFQRAGLCQVRSDSSASLGVNLCFIGGSAGVVSDVTATASAQFVRGICLASGASGSITAMLNFPEVAKYVGTDAS